MAGCFQLHFHNIKLHKRSRSLEHLVSMLQSWTPPGSPRPDQGRSRKSRKHGDLFRSRSEEGLKSSSPRNSRSSSPRGSNTPPRRRFARIVHDDEHQGEEWESPYIVRHYSREYWEKQQAEARRLQQSDSHLYNVNTDHTILKTNKQKTLRKTKSLDCDPDEDNDNDSPITDRHPSFSNKVQVIEFFGKEKITKHVHHMHAAMLVDTEEVIYEEEQLQSIKKLIRQDSKDEFRKAKESLELVVDCSSEEEKESTPEKVLPPENDKQPKKSSLVTTSSSDKEMTETLDSETNTKLSSESDVNNDVEKPSVSNDNPSLSEDATKEKHKKFRPHLPHLKFFKSHSNSKDSNSSKDSTDSDVISDRRNNSDDVTKEEVVLETKRPSDSVQSSVSVMLVD